MLLDFHCKINPIFTILVFLFKWKSKWWKNHKHLICLYCTCVSNGATKILIVGICKWFLKIKPNNNDYRYCLQKEKCNEVHGMKFVTWMSVCLILKNINDFHIGFMMGLQWLGLGQRYYCWWQRRKLLWRQSRLYQLPGQYRSHTLLAVNWKGGWRDINHWIDKQ